MGLTILRNPSYLQPAFNEVMCIMESTDTAQPGFKYGVEVYSLSSVLLGTIEAPARPDGKGVIDIAPILQSYITSDIYLEQAGLANPFEPDTNRILGYKAYLYQLYDSAPYTPLSGAHDGNKYAFNGVFNFLDWINYVEGNYLIWNTTATKFFTNSPRALTIGSSDYAWLHMGTNTANAILRMNVTVYKANGNSRSYTIDNPHAALVDTSHRFVRIPTGTYNLAQIQPPFYIVDPEADSEGPIVWASDDVRYTVKILDATQTVSETFTYNIDDQCSKFEHIRLHFLNKLGGFDSFTFNLASRKTGSITRSGFKKPQGTLVGSAWVHNTSDRLECNNVTSKDKMTITSDWLTEEESVWLRELVESPEVFQELNGKLIAVNVLNSNYEEGKIVNQKLFNLTLDFEYTFTNNKQTF